MCLTTSIDRSASCLMLPWRYKMSWTGSINTSYDRDIGHPPELQLHFHIMHPIVIPSRLDLRSMLPLPLFSGRLCPRQDTSRTSISPPRRIFRIGGAKHTPCLEAPLHVVDAHACPKSSDAARRSGHAPLTGGFNRRNELVSSLNGDLKQLCGN